jgi:hypothetical protein
MSWCIQNHYYIHSDNNIIVHACTNTDVDQYSRVWSYTWNGENCMHPRYTVDYTYCCQFILQYHITTSALIQHCEADKSETVVYADVFSSSLIRPKHQTQILELYDDRVNYAEVNHKLISATHNIDNSEVGKYTCLYNSLYYTDT